MNKHKVIVLTSFLVTTLIISVAFLSVVDASEGKSTETDYNSVTYTKTIYHISKFAADLFGNLGRLDLHTHATATLNISTPILISAIYPSNITPNKPFPVLVNFAGGNGTVSLGLNLSGHVYFNATKSFVYQSDFYYNMSWLAAYFSTVIGDDKTGTIVTNYLDIYSKSFEHYSLLSGWVDDEDVYVYLRFHFKYIATTYLTGNISLFGNGITEPVSKPINGTSNLITANAISDPIGGEYVGLNVTNLKYHVRYLKVYLSGIELMAQFVGIFDWQSSIYMGIDNFQLISYSNTQTKSASIESSNNRLVNNENHVIDNLGTMKLANIYYSPYIFILKSFIFVILLITVAFILPSAKEFFIIKHRYSTLRKVINKPKKQETIVSCPFCGYEGRIPQSKKSAWLRCPKCGRVFKIEKDDKLGSDVK